MQATPASKPEPGQDGFVQYHKTIWRNNGYSDPVSFTVIEYLGNGDPAFGGNADDRALGANGEILDRQRRCEGVHPLIFSTIEEVHLACQAIKNRREGSILGLVPSWN
ncbi:hypothetical protein [Diaphorobacter sp. J5-51]|uniref:hypothetical protein n=1 Tax=Diaphorobacter sp. J5-51 TaxID=680496 RepID=UPI0012FC7F93|nr:hypothetical protein [Diaphorobacter sp. J5-51]